MIRVFKVEQAATGQVYVRRWLLTQKSFIKLCRAGVVHTYVWSSALQVGHYGMDGIIEHD
jgi:hypothetical protein